MPNAELDDLILLRADGTPTYNLSVVVDDHDMGITHVIRGDDHLNNAFRQTQIYRALDWEVPRFAHVPLIHGPDGAKMSKRHGAIGVEQYRELGYLPEALRNYLLRLGWSHGDDEIIATDDAIRWFDIARCRPRRRRASTRPSSTASTGIISAPPMTIGLVGLVAERLEKEFGRALVGDRARAPGERDARPEAARRRPSSNWRRRPASMSRRGRSARRRRRQGADRRRRASGSARSARRWRPWREGWTAPVLEAELRRFAESGGLKLGAIAQPLRAALTGSLASPGIFEVMEVLGRDESLARIADAAHA